MRNDRHFKSWLAAITLLILLGAFQNCSPVSLHGMSNSSESSAPSNGGNDQGYGGKVYAQIGTCPDATVRVKNQIQVATGDASRGLMTVENCAAASREVSGFRYLPTGDALVFAGNVFVQEMTAQDPPQTVQAKSLTTFVRMQFLSSAKREPSTQELNAYQTQYNPAGGTGCKWIASNLIRGQESMTMQEAMAPADRSAFIIQALLDRTGSPSEIAQWTENAPAYTWQMIYDDILATTEFSNRCAGYGLGL